MVSSHHSPPSRPHHILIAGGGFVGAALAARLEEAGNRVTLLVRTPESAQRLSESFKDVRALDVADASALRTLAAELGTPDAIVACASTRGGSEADYRQVYSLGSANLLAQFSPARFIFTSSTSVYAQNDGSEVTETSDTLPTAPTGRILLEAESVVLKAGGIVLRLGGLYGAERWSARERVREGTAQLGEDSEDYLNLIHRDDAVAALILLLSIPTISGVYNATDGTPITRRQLYAALATHYGAPQPAVEHSLPHRKRGRSHKRVVSARLTALGWSPTFPHIRVALESGE